MAPAKSCGVLGGCCVGLSGPRVLVAPRQWQGLWGPAQDAEAWRPWRRRVSSGGWVCSGSAPPTAVPPRLGRSLPGAVTSTVLLAACLRTRGWDTGSCAFSPRLAGGRALPWLPSPHRLLRPCLLGSISPGTVFLVSGAEPASTSLPFFMSLRQGLRVLLGCTCSLWGKGFVCPFLQSHSPC